MQPGSETPTSKAETGLASASAEWVRPAVIRLDAGNAENFRGPAVDLGVNGS